LWQFINVLADRLDRTSLELSEARLALVSEEDEEQRRLFTAPPLPGAAVEDPFATPRSASANALGTYGLGYEGIEPARGEVQTPQAPLVDDLPPTPRRPVESSFGPPIAERVSALPPPPPLAERVSATAAAGKAESGPDDRHPTLPVHPTPALPPDSWPSDEAAAAPAHRPTNPGSPDARRRAAERAEPDEWTQGTSGDSLESQAEPTTRERDPEPAAPTRPKGPLGRTLRSSGVPDTEAKDDGPFRPTKETVRLSEAPEALEELRRQFREKLAAERAAEAARAAEADGKVDD
jgi:hypothetical protein